MIRLSDMLSKNEQSPRCVVRISTDLFKQGNRYVMSKAIYTLKRKTDYDILHEECSSLGEVDAIQRITNFNDVSDGVYELVRFNYSTDWETGTIDDYDLKLVPYEEN